MKRFLSIIIIAAAACGLVSAQNSFKPIVGLRAGIDVNMPSNFSGGGTNMKVFNMGVGAEIGAMVRFPLFADMYFEPGLMLVFDQYSTTDSDGATDLGNVYKYGFRIPALLGYTIRVMDQALMTIHTGPEFNFAFAGNYSSAPKGISLFGDSADSQKRFNCVWNVGIGFPIKNFVFGVDASFGLTDLLKSEMFTFYEYRITPFLTYYF